MQTFRPRIQLTVVENVSAKISSAYDSDLLLLLGIVTVPHKKITKLVKIKTIVVYHTNFTTLSYFVKSGKVITDNKSSCRSLTAGQVLAAKS